MTYEFSLIVYTLVIDEENLKLAFLALYDYVEIFFLGNYVEIEMETMAKKCFLVQRIRGGRDCI